MEITNMETIVSELSALAIDDARDVVKAAQIMLQGKKDEIRNLCKPWGVQLTVQKRKRAMENIKEDLKRTLIKRAMELKRRTDGAARNVAAEEANTEFCVDTVLSETRRGLLAINT